MSPSSGATRRNLARKLAICTAALAVCLLPTGCDLVLPGVADQAMSPPANGSSESDHGHDVVVVPVGNTTDDRDSDRDGDGDDRASDEQPADEQPADEQPADEQPAEEAAEEAPEEEAPEEEAAAEESAAGQVNGLDLLGRDCTASDLEIHDGFQAAPRCIETSFGEVSTADQGPQLLITGAPDTVGVDEEFRMTVSTRNLVRDRFLGAAAGGYYLESSFLNSEGIQRGHFHSACRMLDRTDEAPQPARSDFFLATQDNGGGVTPDEVTITVPGLPAEGEAQCAIWAGDGSHRIPMMELVDQIPAFDTVRLTVG